MHPKSLADFMVANGAALGRQMPDEVSGLINDLQLVH
jgi:hypothetical protein